MSPSYLSSKEKAYQQYDIATHLLNVTIPMTKDNKILLGIVHNLFTSVEATMTAILQYERDLQLVSRFNDVDFQSKFNTFRSKSVRRNQISGSIVALIQELKEIVDLHQKSPMVFQRGASVVICDKQYELKTLTARDIAQYMNQAKEFLEVMERVMRLR